MNKKTINVRQMMQMIKYSVEIFGYSEELFMEHAALAVIRNINLSSRDNFAMVCGPGKKGRIGLRISRILLGKGKKVYLFLTDSIDDLEEDYKKDVKMIENLGGIISSLKTIGDLESFPEDLLKVNTIIDAIMDIDYDDSYLGSYDFIIETINRSRIHTISIDQPSGINADTGKINTVAVGVDLIVALQFVKEGLINSSHLIGTKLAIEDIGIPVQVIRRVLV